MPRKRRNVPASRIPYLGNERTTATKRDIVIFVNNGWKNRQTLVEESEGLSRHVVGSDRHR